MNNQCAGSVGKAWVRCLRTILDRGVIISDGPDRLIEFRNYLVTIASVDRDDALLRRFADQDRIQLMRRKYASLEPLPEYKVSYGALLYDHLGVDQVRWAVGRLREKRETKSATISLHTPGESELSCLSLLDFKVRAESVHMTVVYRSQNVYGSQPGNLLALREVQERVAADVGASVGEVTLHAVSAHIYEADLAAVKEILRAFDAGQVH